MPPDLLAAVEQSSTVREVLDQIDAERLAELKGRVYYSKAGSWRYGEEKELVRDKTGQSWTSDSLSEQSASSPMLPSLRLVPQMRRPDES